MGAYGTSSFCLHSGSIRAMWASGAHPTPQCSFSEWIRDVWAVKQPWGCPYRPGTALLVSPTRVLPVGPQQGASCAPSSLAPLGPWDRHILFGPFLAKCVSPGISFPHRVSIYQGLSGCQTHARQEHMVSKTASASWSLWTNGDRRAMAWHRVTGAGREGLSHHRHHHQHGPTWSIIT